MAEDQAPENAPDGGAPSTLEIATIRDGRDITRGYIFTDLLPSQDEILRATGGGLQVYEKVRRDDQVQAALQQRFAAVVERPWKVEPGGTKRIDRQAADFLREELERIQFDAVTQKMLLGVFYGYSIAEVNWAPRQTPSGLRWSMAEIRVRNRRRFGFGQDFLPRLLTSKNPFGEPLPPRKFWHFSCGADNDDEPYGLGLGHWLYWPVLFKREGIKFWAKFLEKYGAPTPIGKYPANASKEEKGKLLEATAAVHSEAGIIIPEGMMLDLLEATRGGSVDYSKLVDVMDKAIAKVVVSQTMTTDDGSSRAQGEVHERVGNTVTRTDADLICKSFEQGPAAWLTAWNFDGAAVPRVYREMEQAEDLNTTAERDKKLKEVGYRRTPESVKEVYGDGYEEVKAPAAPVVAPGGSPAGPRVASEEGAVAAEFAEAAERDAIDKLVAEAIAGDGWEPLMAEMADPVRRLVAEAESMEALRDGLAELLRADPDKLAERLAQSAFAARLAGDTGADQ